MQIIDVRRAYGIECSEFSYDIDSALSVTDAWAVIDDILNSEIVRRKSNPRIKLPANRDAVAAIEPFALKSTDRIFEMSTKEASRKFCSVLMAKIRIHCGLIA